MTHSLAAAAAVRAFNAWLGRPDWLSPPATAPLLDDFAALGRVAQRLDACGMVDWLSRSRHRLLPSFNGLAMTYAPSLGAAITSALEALALDEPHLRGDSAVEQGRRVIRLSFPQPLGPAETAIGLMFVVSALRCLESFIPLRRGEIHIHCAAPAPGDLGPWRRLAPAAVSFGEEWAVSYPSAWDSHRNPLHDRSLWQMGRRSLTTKAALRLDDKVVARVRRIVADAIETGESPPPLRAVALRLGWSSRSLERRLMNEGATYRDITESERKRRAVELLDDGGRSIQDVSDSLGFADRTSFTRSFRAWFGVPPARYRARSLRQA